MFRELPEVPGVAERKFASTQKKAFHRPLLWPF
jgi:hypothetical protein